MDKCIHLLIVPLPLPAPSPPPFPPTLVSGKVSQREHRQKCNAFVSNCTIQVMHGFPMCHKIALFSRGWMMYPFPCSVGLEKALGIGNIESYSPGVLDSRVFLPYKAQTFPVKSFLRASASVGLILPARFYPGSKWDCQFFRGNKRRAIEWNPELPGSISNGTLLSPTLLPITISRNSGDIKVSDIAICKDLTYKISGTSFHIKYRRNFIFLPARGDFGSRRGRNNLNKDTLSSLNNGDTLSPGPTGVDRIINKPGLIFTLACHLNASLPRVLTSEPCATLALRSDYDENRVSSSHLQLCGEPGAGGGWVPWRVEVRIFRNATRSEISNVRKYHLIREVPAWISSTPCSLHIQADRSGLLPLRHPLPPSYLPLPFIFILHIQLLYLLI